MRTAAVFANEFGPCPRINRVGLALIAATLASTNLALAADNDEPPFSVSSIDTMVAASLDTNAGPRVEISAAPVIRMNSLDGPFSTTRLDFTSWPRTTESSMVGISLGLSVPPNSPLAPRSTQSVDVGLRWRSTLDSTRRIDVAAWRKVTPVPDTISLINGSSGQDVYGTRVEMQFTAARYHGLVPELGAIGVQLNGGARLSLRAKHGKPMLYYRARF
ncbi:MAG TPA: hypothetical protein VLJ57_23810 [Burkholderiaceae bacterium]|nr:hypothetical protein [Burkholderiaceae bacterium]